RVVAPVAVNDADRASGEELSDGRRRAVDVLGGVVLADEATRRGRRAGIARAREDADVPAVAVGLPVGETGTGIATADKLIVAVPVEVGDCGGREHRVSLEPREPSQHGAVVGAQRVSVLAERSRL